MIYIYTSFYNNKSNGIAVTYELVRILARSGLEARILCYENERYDFSIPEDFKPFYISKAGIPKKIADEDIVIYLDTVDEQIEKASRAVYWLLNKPSVLTGEKLDFKPTDVLVAYSRLVHKDLPQLFIMKDERELFSDIRTKQKKKHNMVSVYFGKVKLQNVLAKNEQLAKIVNKYNEISIITRLSPSDRNVTLTKIAQSDLLISFDSLSSMNYEATLLGTPVLLMDDSYGIKDADFNVGNYGFAFSEDEINKARCEVYQAFETYCNWLENQDSSVLESVKQIIDRVISVRSSDKELAANMQINQKANADFLAFYNELKEPFFNIDFPISIPSSTKKVLKLAAKKNPSKKTAEAIIAVLSDWNNSLYMIYAAIKPRWIKNVYKKLPSSLKLHELLFLLFRRIFVFWKK